MNTFLPYPDFARSAACLDKKRLWKQVLEAEQIRNVLVYGATGYAHHPAVAMWRGYEAALLLYRDMILQEWLKRTLHDPPLIDVQLVNWTEYTPWLGDKRLHDSHKAALLAKNQEHYSQFHWDVKPMDLSKRPLPYYWPKGRL